ESVVQTLEIAHRKGHDTQHVFVCEKRQGGTLVRRRLFRCEPHVVEECGNVRIAMVHPVPDTGYFPVSEVGRDECCLARAGRCRNPSYRIFAGCIELPVQSLAW